MVPARVRSPKFGEPFTSNIAPPTLGGVFVVVAAAADGGAAADEVSPPPPHPLVVNAKKSTEPTVQIFATFLVSMNVIDRLESMSQSPPAA